MTFILDYFIFVSISMNKITLHEQLFKNHGLGDDAVEKEKIRQMVKICQLYYLEGYNQQQLAKKFGISRPQISRIISSAKEEGIVEIKVNNPFGDESIIEQELVDKFGLNDAVIVDTANMTKDQSFGSVAKAGAIFLESVIKKGDEVGVMAGKAIQQVVQLINGQAKKNVHVIPLVGGLGIQGANWHANSNVIQLAENLQCDYYVLNAPVIVSSPEMKLQLIQEEDIKKVLDRYQTLKIAVVGIGEITEEATFFKTMNLNQKELTDIKDAGAVCSIGKTFLNSKGEEVAKELSDRMIGISTEHLKEVDQVIAVAAGEKKIDAIVASLLGQWVDVLVTDVQTGKHILQYST
ncbi:DNA-binding transcriptional regulator LsrR (DeoR family) [Pseudogracilibacillus auburnensis]|uniref:DNA-binding transcriptional regulator LsrR (DeoR family) n=1 Tax=Pseudogracilibacillus auburnensis TaxID=1494959 RepID=A0A2V3WNB1_9BACI|nr:DNA-binding transcriptional regulator LsrR (DeoR family) [Pseudogracilibacillus auburnensis]